MVRTMYIIILLVLFWLPIRGYSAERVMMSTDRTLYVSGESVNYVAFVDQTDNPGRESDADDGSTTSNVLYVEIVSPDGKSISKNKTKIIQNFSRGYILIPEETLTGYYYIRAYTKIMRNNGPGSYAYQLLKIVNPYKEDVASANLPDTGITYFPETEGETTLSLSLNKDIYNNGEEIRVTVNNDIRAMMPLVSVSVIPQFTVNSFSHVIPLQSDNGNQNNYCRETHGVSLSGELKDASNGQSIVDEVVNLSVIGPGRDFISVRTDGLGRFNFALPELNGERDLYISTSVNDERKLRLLIDNDFCNISSAQPVPEFSLTAEERAAALKLAINARIRKEFNDSLQAPMIVIDNSPFYGTPDQVLRLDDFIALPTLEEYFNEITSLAKVRKSAGKKFIKVAGTSLEMTTYAPLIMIDYVAVSDHERVLNASPGNIRKIEIINRPYLKGNQLYGGIVNIISRKGDFAGIDLPASGLFIYYRFLSESALFEFNPTKNIPDARNTVYFNQLSFDKNEANVQCIAPKTPGIYEVRVQAFSKNGEIITTSISTEVVQKGD